MANVLPVGALYKYIPHRKRVLRLYKRAVLHLFSHCMADTANNSLDTWSYERTLLRARFDAHKTETDPKKAAMLLRLGEEELFLNQFHDPLIFPNSAEYEGPMWQRFETWKADNLCFDAWSPEEKAHFPDFFEKRKRWYQIRKEVWDEEMECLKQFDKENIKANRPMTDEFPAARTKDGYPPFWWRTVSRPLERPQLMEWFPYQRDHTGIQKWLCL